MAEIRVNATGGLKLYDADDSHYAQIVAGTITSNVDAITLGHDTVTIADNLSLGSDSAVLKFGADGDTTLTHTDGTGLTLNSTNKICFNDASQFIQGSSNAVLSLGATDEIDLTATAVDLNGTLNVSGVATFQSTPVFPDGSIAVADLDIDGATDIGAAIVDADLFIIDDGAGGANRKVTASRIKTYAGGAVTAINNATANELVTIGATTTELEAESGLTFDAASDPPLLKLQGMIELLHTADAPRMVRFDAPRNAAGDSVGTIEWQWNNTSIAKIEGAAGNDTTNKDDGHIDFYTAPAGTMARRMRVGNDGRFFIGAIVTDQSSNSDDNYGVTYIPGEAFQISSNGSTVFNMNRQNSDGNIVNFYQEGSEEGNISVSGSTVAYNTFCGTHWSRLADNSKPTILRGTVVESIGTMMDWYQVKFKTAEMSGDQFIKKPITLPDGKSVGDTIKYTYESVEYDAEIIKEDNERLPKCKISDTANSKAVYGVFMAWDDQDNNGDDDEVNDMYIASLGSFVVRIHKDETVAIGNWLVSNGDGTAKVLAGNTTITADVQSSLIGKVTSTTKTHTHADDSYCVPCTLHCG